MLSERELTAMAHTYRHMAKQARDPRFKIEFAERAERYETVVSAIRRAKTETPLAPPEKRKPPN